MILKGDCLKVMKAMKSNSVDAVVCDPPYGLEFMGKEWDKLESIPKGYIECKGEKSIIKKKMPRFHQTVEHNSSMQLWHTQWLTEAYRVLKPGGSMLVMGGTRTSHRLACAIEDSGFIIKDTLMWLYGSGFPKAQDLGKMIDKRAGKEREKIGEQKITGQALGKTKGFKGCFDGIQEYKREWDITIPTTDLAKHWDGFKVGGIKPAYEPIIWAVKPPEGSYVDNVLKWNVGAVNVNECRISLDIDNELEYNNKHEKSKSQNNLSRMSSRIPDTQKPSFENKNPNLQSSMQKQDDGGTGESSLERRNILQRRLQIHLDGKRLSNGTQDNNEELSGKEIKVIRNRSSYKRDKNRQQNRQFNTLQKPRNTHFTESCNDRQENQKIQKPLGRFPANIILSHHPECVQVGVKRVSIGKKLTNKNTEPTNANGQAYGWSKCPQRYKSSEHYGEETVESWDCHPDCAVFILDQQSGILKSGGGFKGTQNHTTCFKGFRGNSPNPSMGGDSGGASRFYYCAKSSRGERNAGLEGMEESKPKNLDASGKGWGITYPDGSERPRNSIKNNHPTVKPIKLFEYLIKLVTREGQVILDPFLGSGTTAIAAHNVGRKCVGIEREDEYLEIAKRRIDYWENQPKQMEMGA